MLSVGSLASAGIIPSEQVVTGAAVKPCPAGTVAAVIGGKRKCLKAGQSCKRKLDRQYHRHGFHCHTGRLSRRASGPPALPAGAEVVARIPVPDSGGVGVGAGSVWALDRASGLLRIDPATNTVVSQVPGVIGAAPVVGEGAVWVASGARYNRLLRVDIGASSFLQIATGPFQDEYPIAAVVTAGAVWVANHHGGTIARIDPRANRLVASVPWGPLGGGGPYHMATDGSSVWVTASRNSEVVQIDTASNQVVARTTVATGACGGVAVDDSAVWIASGYDQPFLCWNRENQGVSRIDRATGRVRRIDVGGRPIDVRLAFGSVWVVTDAPTVALVRLDPASGRLLGRLQLRPEQCLPNRAVGHCPHGPDYATALASGFDSLWVRLDAGELLRLEPR
jgi:streptogramin lyase